MKRFILFFRGGEAGEDWSAWVNKLKSNDSLVQGAPLMKDGKIVELNGEKIKEFNFDISENARAFVVMQAENMEEAIRLSKDCPVFGKGGNITIRPIEEEF